MSSRLSRLRFVLVSTLLTLTALLASGCDDNTIQPFTSSEYTYTMNGRLEASADTQTIRVEPLQDSTILGTEQPIEATVELESLASGKTSRLTGSVERIDRAVVHNFRTDQSIALGARYRLTATNPDGRTTSAEVTLPQAFPQVRNADSLRYCEGEGGDPRVVPLEFDVQASDPVASILVRYRVFVDGEGLRGFTYPHRGSARETASGFEVQVDADRDLTDVAEQFRDSFFGPPDPARAVEVDIITIASGPEWPGEDYRLADLEEIAQPTQFSNVENGLGLVVGTAADTTSVPVRFQRPDPLCENVQ